VGTGRPDREEFTGVVRQQNGVVADMPDEHVPVRETVDRDSQCQVGTGRLRWLCTHRGLPMPPNQEGQLCGNPVIRCETGDNVPDMVGLAPAHELQPNVRIRGRSPGDGRGARLNGNWLVRWTNKVRSQGPVPAVARYHSRSLRTNLGCSVDTRLELAARPRE
jgi:hypothetical protein